MFLFTPLSYTEIPDGNYGWIIVLASFICLSIASGSQFAFGLFYSDLLVLSLNNAPITAGVLSAEYCALQGFGVISGLLIKRYDERLVAIGGGFLSALGFVCSSFSPSIEILFLTHGIMVGAGFSLVCTASGLVVTRWFAKRRATAVGIVVAGSGVGTMVIGPVVQIALDTFGWRGAMRVVAGITCVIPLFALLFRPIIVIPSTTLIIDDDDDKTTNVDKKTTELPQVSQPITKTITTSLSTGSELVGPILLLDSLFLTWCIALALYSGSFYSVLTHFVTASKESGTSSSNAALLVSIQGFANIAGRLSMGALSDVCGISRGYVIAVCIGLLALSVGGLTFLLPFFVAQVSFMIIAGLCGAAVIAATPFLIEFVGMRRIPIALGWTATLQAPLTAAVPPLVGYFRSTTGSYTSVWIPLGVTMLLAAFLAAWVQREAHRRLQILETKESSISPLLSSIEDT